MSFYSTILSEKHSYFNVLYYFKIEVSQQCGSSAKTLTNCHLEIISRSVNRTVFALMEQSEWVRCPLQWCQKCSVFKCGWAWGCEELILSYKSWLDCFEVWWRNSVCLKGELQLSLKAWHNSGHSCVVGLSLMYPFTLPKSNKDYIIWFYSNLLIFNNFTVSSWHLIS